MAIDTAVVQEVFRTIAGSREMRSPTCRAATHMLQVCLAMRAQTHTVLLEEGAAMLDCNRNAEATSVAEVARRARESRTNARQRSEAQWAR